MFSVELPDDQCESIRKVGDLYRLVLEKLTLPYISSDEIETNSMGMVRPLNEARQLMSEALRAVPANGLDIQWPRLPVTSK